MWHVQIRSLSSLALFGLVVAVTGCKTDQEKLVGTWEMDCVGMVERLAGSAVPEKIVKCEKSLGITIVLAADGGFSFTSRDRLHQVGKWHLDDKLLVWQADDGKPTRNTFEVGSDDLFLKSPVTGAILVMKRAGPGVLKPAPAGIKRPESEAERIGKALVEALRKQDVQGLTAITAKQQNEELAAEIARTREVTLIRSFGDLVDKLEDDGIQLEAAEYERIEVEEPGFGSFAVSGEVYFKCQGKRYYVLVDWMKSKTGPTVIGTSTWYKAAG